MASKPKAAATVGCRGSVENVESGNLLFAADRATSSPPEDLATPFWSLERYLAPEHVEGLKPLMRLALWELLGAQFRSGTAGLPGEVAFGECVENDETGESASVENGNLSFASEAPRSTSTPKRVENDAAPRAKRQLVVAARSHRRHWSKLRELLDLAFPVCPDGRRRNPALHAELQALDARRERLSKRAQRAGIYSGQARRARRDGNPAGVENGNSELNNKFNSPGTPSEGGKNRGRTLVLSSSSPSENQKSVCVPMPSLPERQTRTAATATTAGDTHTQALIHSEPGASDRERTRNPQRSLEGTNGADAEPRPGTRQPVERSSRDVLMRAAPPTSARESAADSPAVARGAVETANATRERPDPGESKPGPSTGLRRRAAVEVISAWMLAFPQDSTARCALNEVEALLESTGATTKEARLTIVRLSDESRARASKAADGRDFPPGLLRSLKTGALECALVETRARLRAPRRVPREPTAEEIAAAKRSEDEQAKAQAEMDRVGREAVRAWKAMHAREAHKPRPANFDLFSRRHPEGWDTIEEGLERIAAKEESAA